MKPSPCLHPVQITDYRGYKQLVACGHCSACLVNKGRQRSQVLADSINRFPYKFLITLTFSDENLPLARFDVNSQTLYHDLDCDYLGEVHHKCISDLPASNFEFLEKCFNKFGGLPVLSHQLLIKWKKRFRYYFKKIYKNENIYLYAVGEYGPESFRPHYHILFGTTAPIKTSVLKECVCTSWTKCYQDGQKFIRRSVGFVDVCRVTNRGCENYVAQYLSCTTHLPQVLARAPWRPFSAKSVDTDYRLLHYGLRDLRKVFFSKPLTIDVSRNGTRASVPIPTFIQSRLWPKLPRFNTWSFDGLLQLYGIFDKGLRFDDLQEVRCFKRLTDLKVDLPFCGQEDFIRYDKIEPEYITLVKQLVFYNADNEYISDEEIQKRNFMRLWYVSKRVSNNARIFGISVRDYVRHIVDYWTGFELDKLKRFYELQQKLLDDPYEPVELSDLMSLYYNTSEYECDVGYYYRQFNASPLRNDILNISEQRKYQQLSERILLDTTKTKKRNDNFYVRGKQRKVFVPHLKRKINNFLSN